MVETLTKPKKSPKPTAPKRARARSDELAPRTRTGRDLLQYRQTFARVLREVLDQMPDVPRQDAGRYRWLADRFGVGVGSPRKWLEGRALPAMDKFLEITETLGVSPQRLLRGEEPRYIDLSKLADTRALSGAANDDLVRITAYNAGVAARSENAPSIALSPDFLVEQLGLDSATAPVLSLLQCQGPEMAPTIAAGDWVIFKDDDGATYSDGLYVMRLRMTSGAFIRRCAATPEGMVARCDNLKLKIPDQALRADSGVHIVGRIIAVLRVSL